MSKPRALVVGGSLGGLFAANLLRAIGWDVALFERARGNLAGRGAGLGARDELFAVMRRIGAIAGKSVGAEVLSRQCRNVAGDIVHEVPQFAFATAWDRVYQPLRDALPDEFYRSGMQFERYEEQGNRVAAHFADGSREEGDILVGADGLYSTVRAQAFPQAKPSYVGYVAWRFVVTERTMPRALHDDVFKHMIFSFPRGELAFGIPMPPSEGARRSKYRAQCVWFRNADFATELPLLCTDATGKCHGLSIPPPLIRPDLVAELKDAARKNLSPHLAAFVEGAPQPILQPVYDLVSTHMARGRVALVGDSASVVRPHVATGVTKAALDAQALVDALAARNGDIGAALADYDRERPAFGARLVERGRWLGADIGKDKPAIEMTNAPGERLDALLRGYGAAGVIDGEAAM